jgi:hypothetical protein
MDLNVLFWLVLGAMAFAIISRSVGDPARMFSGLWGYRPPGWPTGVQEDDDAHWSWARPRSEQAPAPQIVEDDGSPIESDVPDVPDVHAVRYEVRSRVDRTR